MGFDTIEFDLVAVDVVFVLALSFLSNWIKLHNMKGLVSNPGPGSKRFFFCQLVWKKSLDLCTPGYVEPFFYLRIYFKRAFVILEHFLSSSTFKTSLCGCQVFVYKTNTNQFSKSAFVILEHISLLQLLLL